MLHASDACLSFLMLCIISLLLHQTHVEHALTMHYVTTSNNSDFTVVIVTVGSASGSLKAEPKECLTGKGQVLSKGLRAERISRWLTSILLLIKIV